MGTKRERGRVLVGEGDPAVAGALRAALAAGGYEVCVAGEGGPAPRPERTGAGDVAPPFDVIVWGLETGPPAQEARLSDPAGARALILVSGAGRLATAV